MFVGIFSPSSYQYSLLALLWRERTEVRVAPSDFTLTLALSRKRARGQVVPSPS
jgi:hypothetical protein